MEQLALFDLDLEFNQTERCDWIELNYSEGVAKNFQHPYFVSVQNEYNRTFLVQIEEVHEEDERVANDLQWRFILEKEQIRRKEEAM